MRTNNLYVQCVQVKYKEEYILILKFTTDTLGSGQSWAILFSLCFKLLCVQCKENLYSPLYKNKINISFKSLSLFPYVS